VLATYSKVWFGLDGDVDTIATDLTKNRPPTAMETGQYACMSKDTDEFRKQAGNSPPLA
jgi:hypothetical protein